MSVELGEEGGVSVELEEEGGVSVELEEEGEGESIAKSVGRG